PHTPYEGEPRPTGAPHLAHEGEPRPTGAPHLAHEGEPRPTGAPHTPYGAEKLRAASALLATPRLSAAWGRIFYLYGEHEDPRRLVPSVARALVRGERARLGPGTQLADFLEAREAAAAFVALLASEVTGVVNLGSGERRSVADVARELAALAGRPDALDLGALPPREGEPPRLVPELGRLRDEVGFRPSRGLREGLAAALAFWRQAEASAPAGP
ncbi:MAG TPA: NAD(P)-dependent oxidoreductase, partial [Polyangiaceae bacterium]|nr:NAD(P)-dependent oxidoreductase [Polyangiaceae bacterium]